MWILIGIAGGIVILILVCLIIGACCPKEHHGTGAVKLKAKPEDVWNLVVNLSDQQNWYPIAKRIERLPDKDGHEVYKMMAKGSPPFAIEVVEKNPPTRTVWTISEPKASFSGRWEFDIQAVDGGSRVRLTEIGYVPNPFFRFMIRLFGTNHYVKKYLASLAKKMGEPDAPVGS